MVSTSPSLRPSSLATSMHPTTITRCSGVSPRSLVRVGRRPRRTSSLTTWWRRKGRAGREGGGRWEVVAPLSCPAGLRCAEQNYRSTLYCLALLLCAGGMGVRQVTGGRWQVAGGEV